MNLINLDAHTHTQTVNKPTYSRSQTRPNSPKIIRRRTIPPEATYSVGRAPSTLRTVGTKSTATYASARRPQKGIAPIGPIGPILAGSLMKGSINGSQYRKHQQTRPPIQTSTNSTATTTPTNGQGQFFTHTSRYTRVHTIAGTGLTN